MESPLDFIQEEWGEKNGERDCNVLSQVGDFLGIIITKKFC